MIEGEEPSYRPLGKARDDARPVGAPLAQKRLALITGGHRRLGGIIAATLAKAGHSLAIHGSHDTRLDSHLALTLEEEGTEWDGFVVDFADPESAEELVGMVAARFGRPPDILVNSAAIFGQDRLETVTADDLMRHYAVNCAAPAMLTKAFATVPAGVGDRCIINILDQRIDHPHADQLAYTLSKLALAGLTRTSAHNLAPRIRVNAVAPGLTIATADYDEAQMERLGALMPLGRLPQAEEIAQAVLYLVNATAVTGQTLYVDGGAHLKSYDRDFMHLCR
ncbi:SDR family oxidoreductase [Sphingobium sp. BYY-5]|uniref:SDR family oxidoreductase n=1 Tax=Sphingobium sp. BYY-5 TaxID=2926400 RepID=UPI001FA7000C|nr:SDR family oxidoreductase [Sphingobium sp. BYY-5]MCI4589739.1 SDR family oxidoreductase [Sphingobium sp. BYY-5]